MKLHSAIAEYVDHIRHERRLAKTTCKHYQSWLRGFLLWLDANSYGSDPDLDAYNSMTLRRFQMDKTKEGARPRTIHSAFFPLRGLGEYLIEQKHLSENPCSSLKMPKKDAAVRHTLTDVNIAALFDACKRQRTPRQIALSSAILSVLAYGGLRREEACCLRLDDIDLSEKSILVRDGKGSKSRRVFVCGDAVNALREWLSVREPECKPAWLFMLDRGRRIHHRGIATLIETLAATAGLADNPAVKPHSIRHWAATNLLRNGANIRDVQAFLGHADLQTTCRYLHTSEEQLRDIAELTALRTPTQPQTPQKQEEDGKIIRLSVRDRNADRPRLRRVAR